MRKAVRCYGEERGRRMALRARVNGHALSMANYMAYGEWAVAPDEMDRAAVEGGTDIRTHVYRCPWHTAWAGNGLTPYGRLYCLEIDEALARGFNPELRLEVNSTLANGDARCEFVFREAGKAVSRRGTIMPWDYHAGHLYKTVGGAVVEALGEEGREAVEAAMKAFAGRYGEDAAEIVTAYRETDFDRLPG